MHRSHRLILVAGLITCQLLALSGQAEEQDDPFTGAIDVFRFSFENDQDLDYDRHPDDWIRRIGRDFPHYVPIEIDPNHGFRGQQSLEIQANGGPAILYSPVMRIDSLHAYVFQGWVKTQQLQNDSAIISLSFLNHKRERIQRVLATPVSGTHRDWRRLRIGPISPHPETRFVVVGCHLVTGASADIQGSAWFDDLWMGQLPQLELVSNFRTQFVEPGSAVKVETRISGLDALPPVLYPVFPLWGPSPPGAIPIQPNYWLELQLIDSGDKVRDERRVELAVDSETDTGDAPTGDKSRTVTWDLSAQDYGIYRVKAKLWREDRMIFEQQATFAVLDLVDNRLDGEFGWSFPSGVHEFPLKDLVDVALQGGINWLKYPTWNSVNLETSEQSASISEFFDLLTLRRIQPVGLLNHPPTELRRKFAPNWTGISEVFTQPPNFWSSSLDPVLAKYSSTVQYWQLGDDRDQSFVGIPDLPKTLSTVKRQFDRIGRDTRIGVHWNFQIPLPPDDGLARSFFSVAEQRTTPGPKPGNATKTTYAKWILLKPLAKSKHTPEERGADLVKRMVAAKMTKADAIFAQDVLDPEHGLLNTDGSPTLLFLPWRTTALALQGANFLGSFQLPQGSRNFLFQRDGREDVVMFIWNPEPVEETIYLGESTEVTAINLWGEQTHLATDPVTGRQILPVGPMPLVIRGCSKPLARWRLAMQFESGRLASATGVHQEYLLGRNTFPQGASGKVTIIAPSEWEVEPRTFPLQVAKNEAFRHPMQITLPPNATLGTVRMPIDVEIDADRKYTIRIYRPIQIGLGDVELIVVDRRLENGLLEIEQTLTNKTSPTEILDFECSLFIPGSKRQKKIVTKQAAGESKKFYFVPNADRLKGEELWLRAEQINGRRVLNYRWIVGQEWEN